MATPTQTPSPAQAPVAPTAAAIADALASAFKGALDGPRPADHPESEVGQTFVLSAGDVLVIVSQAIAADPAVRTSGGHYRRIVTSVTTPTGIHAQVQAYTPDPVVTAANKAARKEANALTRAIMANPEAVKAALATISGSTPAAAS